MAKAAALRKPKKKVNPLDKEGITYIDYKDTALLRKFISDRGKIRARRVTGVPRSSSGRSPARSRTRARWRCCRTRRRRAEEEAPTMKIILTQEVTGLGAPGDVVEVKDGYGRNYLLPAGLRDPWTKGAEKQIAVIKRARDAREIRDLGPRQRGQGPARGAQGQLTARAGDGGRLFGSITPAEVADAVKAAGGPTLDQRRLELPGHIKSGAYKVQVRLHPEVTATFG